MKLNIALIALLITQAIAENDDKKDVADTEVKSAKTEDNVKSVTEVSREAESYTVPVEVVKDAVAESEAVKSASPDEHKEDARVERSTPSDVVETLKLDESDKLVTETEHVANRRSNDETTKAASVDEAKGKSGDSGDAKEKLTKSGNETVKDDLSKKGKEDEKTDDLQVRNADDVVVEEKSAAEVPSPPKVVEEIDVLGKAADVEDLSSLVSEVVQDLKANLDSRRMLTAEGSFLDSLARGADEVGAADKASVRSAHDSESLDSPRPQASQTFLPPLMAVPNKQNFFLTPALPLLPKFFPSTHAPLVRMPNIFPNKLSFKANFLPPPEEKQFNVLNSYPEKAHTFPQTPNGFEPQTFPQLLQTTFRPLLPPLPLLNLPNLQDVFRKPAEDTKTQEAQQFPNLGFRRMQVSYGSVPNYQSFTSKLNYF